MKYDDLIYESGPTKFSDYVSDKYNIVHNELYEYALNKYLLTYIKDDILKYIVYDIFCCINNCITKYNDIEQLLTIDTSSISKSLFYKSKQEIESYLNSNYFEYIIEYKGNKEHINNIVDNFMNINVEYNNIISYIRYIVSLVILIVFYTKNETIEIFNNDKLNISDFIIRYNTSTYILDEDNEHIYETDINTRYNSNDELFIYENQIISDIHIGYNKEGRFILDIDENFENIDLLFDRLKNLMGLINTLFYDKICSLLSLIYIDNAKIIEMPANEYWKPSKVMIFAPSFPHRKKIIDLTPYWTLYQDKSDINFVDIKYLEEKIDDNNIIEDIDYVKGTVKILNKTLDNKYNVDYRYINGNMEVDTSIIDNTFTNKIINL